MTVTHDVRIYSILTNRLTKGRSYTARWKVAGHSKQLCRETFTTKAAAEGFRSKLLVAHSDGIAFDVASGLPVTMVQTVVDCSWFEHAKAFVDMKWSRSSAKHRQSIADGLSVATMALLATTEGAPPRGELRDVMYGWAFNKTRREGGDPPKHLGRALRWLESNTVNVSALADPVLVRGTLDSLTVLEDGTAVAASSVARKKAVLSGALKYAVELGLLEAHPFTKVNWSAPKVDGELDMRVVVNPTQAAALLDWVWKDSPDFAAFFGASYYCGLRPQEALHLKEHEYERPKDEGGWGWLLLTGATVATAQGWNDDEGTIEDRPLKHRAASATRRVPVPPQQCRLFDRHIERFGAGAEGRLFVTRRIGKGKYRAVGGQPFSRAAYGRVWQRARRAVLTPEQVKSPLAEVPYHLRSACLSTWLAGGVPAPLVARWAGHSVAVLLKVYARSLYNQEELAFRLIEKTLGADTETPTQIHKR